MITATPLDLSQLKRRLKIKPGYRVSVVNPPAPMNRSQRARVSDPDRAHAIVGFANRKIHLPRLRSVYNAVHTGVPAWICYPRPGRPGSDLPQHWLIHALHQYGVEGVEEKPVDDIWSALRLQLRLHAGGDWV